MENGTLAATSAGQRPRGATHARYRIGPQGLPPDDGRDPLPYAGLPHLAAELHLAAARHQPRFPGAAALPRLLGTQPRGQAPFGAHREHAPPTPGRDPLRPLGAQAALTCRAAVAERGGALPRA